MLIIPIQQTAEKCQGGCAKAEGSYLVLAHSETGHHHVIEKSAQAAKCLIALADDTPSWLISARLVMAQISLISVVLTLMSPCGWSRIRFTKFVGSANISPRFPQGAGLIVLSEYQTKFVPYKHQVEALQQLEGRKAFALLMAMRTGKTKVVLDDFGRLELTGKCNDLLVIAPGGVYRTWDKACMDHLSNDLRTRALIHIWGGGKTSREQHQLEALMAYKGPRVLLINVEALSVVQRAKDLVLAFAKQRQCMGVIDECFVAGTKISTPFGPRKIEELSEGNLVTSSDGVGVIKHILVKKSKKIVSIKARKWSYNNHDSKSSIFYKLWLGVR